MHVPALTICWYILSDMVEVDISRSLGQGRNLSHGW